MGKPRLSAEHRVLRFKLRHMKKSATQRGFVFALDDDEAKRLMLLPCVYCGRINWSCDDKGNGRTVVCFPVNGLDRLQNDRGYLPDNVVPCCKTCNYAKHTLSQEEFQTWIVALVKFQRQAAKSRKGQQTAT